MQKIVFPKFRLLRLVLICSPAMLFGIPLFTYIYADNILMRCGMIYVMIYLGIWLTLSVYEAGEYMILSPDRISIYNFFIPLVSIEIKTLPHIQIEYNEDLLRFHWLIISDYADETAPENEVSKCISYITDTLRQKKKVRVIKSLRLSYDRNYDLAIRDYYGIGANLWKM